MSIYLDNPITYLKGIGPNFAYRIATTENIITVGDLYYQLKRIKNPLARKEFLKKLLRNFKNNKVNTFAFYHMRNFFQKHYKLPIDNISNPYNPRRFA
jgi:hypothetical protein